MRNAKELSTEIYNDYKTKDLIEKFTNYIRLISYSSSINKLEQIKQMEFLVPLIAIELKKRKAWNTIKTSKKSIFLKKEIQKYSSKEVQMVVTDIIGLERKKDFLVRHH